MDLQIAKALFIERKKLVHKNCVHFLENIKRIKKELLGWEEGGS